MTNKINLHVNDCFNQLATDTFIKTYAYRSNSFSDNHLPEPEQRDEVVTICMNFI